jgi:hypothetical protein
MRQNGRWRGMDRAYFSFFPRADGRVAGWTSERHQLFSPRAQRPPAALVHTRTQAHTHLRVLGTVTTRTAVRTANETRPVVARNADAAVAAVDGADVDGLGPTAAQARAAAGAADIRAPAVRCWARGSVYASLVVWRGEAKQTDCFVREKRLSAVLQSLRRQQSAKQAPARDDGRALCDSKFARSSITPRAPRAPPCPLSAQLLARPPPPHRPTIRTRTSRCRPRRPTLCRAWHSAPSPTCSSRALGTTKSGAGMCNRPARPCRKQRCSTTSLCCARRGARTAALCFQVRSLKNDEFFDGRRAAYLCGPSAWMTPSL